MLASNTHAIRDGYVMAARVWNGCMGVLKLFYLKKTIYISKIAFKFSHVDV